MTIKQMVNNIISDFGAGKSVAEKLTKINSDTESLTAWAYEFFTDNFVFIIHREGLVEAFENHCDGNLSEEEKNEQTDDDLWNFLISEFEDEDCTSLHFIQVKDICLTCEADSMGQGGLRFSSLGLFENKTAASESYKSRGYYLCDDPMPSKSEVVNLLRQKLNA